MRVSILLGIPSQEALKESAAAAIKGLKRRLLVEKLKLPPGFVVDDSFDAIAIGGAQDGFTSMEAMSIDNSKDFAIRGSIEVEAVEAIPEELEGKPVFSDPLIAPFPYCSAGAQGRTQDVESKLNVRGLHSRGLDGNNVAIAIMDTGINLAHLNAKRVPATRFDAANSWKPTSASPSPGQYPVDHGTMCAYNALIAAPNATLIDYPILSTSPPVGAISARSVSVAIQAYSHLLTNYAVAFAPGGTHRYAALVVNNSWGIYHPSWDFPVGHKGRYCDNPKHPFAAIVSALTSAGVDIVFAAGNCGTQCPDGRCQGRSSGSIMGANAYDNVLTVAACLVTNDDRLGYSSQGPSIPGMPAQKPDLTAYSHFVGSEAYGQGSPDSGTSTACPVVAGCVAAIRTKLPASAVPPQNLFAQMRLMARQPTPLPTGWNPDFGHGIVEPDSTAQSLGV